MVLTVEQKLALGRAITAGREALGLSKRQLAYRIARRTGDDKMNSTNVSNWESGKHAPRTAEALDALDAELYPDQPGYLRSVIADPALMPTTEPRFTTWQQSVENQLTVLRMDYERRTGRSVDVDVDALLTVAEREKRKNRQRPGAAR